MALDDDDDDDDDDDVGDDVDVIPGKVTLKLVDQGNKMDKNKFDSFFLLLS